MERNKKNTMTMGAVACLLIFICAFAAYNNSDSDGQQIGEYKNYEFETYDGDTVVIDSTNIISQEAVEEPLEWDELPTDAEQMAPGRDFVLFADEDNYYVEDASNGLVTIADK